jgi:hypothetical protein
LLKVTSYINVKKHLNFKKVDVEFLYLFV